MSTRPTANILHRAVLLALVGQRSVERGERYFRDGHVLGLERHAGVLKARVRGTAIYNVRVWVNADGLAYSCECKHGLEGNFCKHAVAVALAWNAQMQVATPSLATRLQALDLRRCHQLLLRIAAHEAGHQLLEQLLSELDAEN